METFFYKRKKRKRGLVRKYVSYFIAIASNEEGRKYFKSMFDYFSNLSLRFYVSIIASLGFIIGVLYIMFFSGYFLIQEIEVESNLDYIPRSIKPYFEKTKHDNIFGFLPRTTIISSLDDVKEKVLRENPIVKKLDVSFFLPNTMNIQVYERNHRGVWCPVVDSAQCFFYSDDGVIFQEAPKLTKGFLLRFVRDERLSEPVLGDVVLSQQDIYELDLLYKALSSISEQPEYITIRDSQEIRVGFYGGWEAYFSRKDPYIRQIDSVYEVLKKNVGSRKNELSYIDARFGDKLFFRYRTTPFPDAPVLQVGPIKKEESEEGKEVAEPENATDENTEN